MWSKPGFFNRALPQLVVEVVVGEFVVAGVVVGGLTVAARARVVRFLFELAPKMG